MAEVTMPRLSDTMERGTVAKWLKNLGDVVQKGEPLVEIETDKANMVLEAYDSGVLERILVREGESVPIGQPIAEIGTARAGGAAAPSAPAASAPPPQAAPAPAAPPPAAPAAPQPAPSPLQGEGEAEAGERLKVSPIARRIAQEHGVDLKQVTGTGPGERITREDVESYLTRQRAAPTGRAAGPTQVAPPAAGPLEGERKPLSRMQATIAHRMTESKTSAPHFYVTSEVVMDAAIDLRHELEAALRSESKIGLNDMVVKAAALALRQFPQVNAFFQDEQLEYHRQINVGIAVALPDGLVVPVLREADRKSLAEVAIEAQALIEKARSHRLAPAEWEGGTFTVSNMGMFDVEEFAAIITPPQSAILAVGSVKTVPFVAGDQIKIGRRMKITLSADHRVFYGATAAQFLQEIKRLLENPLLMLVGPFSDTK